MEIRISADSPQHVSYGDVVSLFCAELKGMVTGDPGISNSLFLDEQANFRERLSPHSLRGSVFTVTPKFEYSCDKAYKKRLQKAKDAGKKMTEHNWRRKLDRADPLYKELTADQGKLAEEREANNVEAKRREGNSLVYGAVIQLKLAGTNKFVTQTKNRARLDKLAMRVEFVQGGGDGAWWIVTDKEGIRPEGDFVRYCDKVCLKNAKFQQSYFYASPDSVVRKNATEVSQVRVSSVFHPSIQTRLEVNASAATCQLEFYPFASWTDSRIKLAELGEESQSADLESTFIHGGDCVTFRRRSMDGIRYLYHKEGQDVSWGLEADVIYPWDLSNVTFEEVQAATSGSEVSQATRLLPGTIWRVNQRRMEMGGRRIGKKSGILLLQNVATGQYLSADDRGEVYMTGTLHQAENAWRIESRGGSAEIKSGQPIWILWDGLQSGVREEQRWLSLKHRDVEDEVEPGQVDETIGASVRIGGRRTALPSTDCGEGLPDRDMVEVKLVDVKEADKVDYCRRCATTLACIQARVATHEPMQSGLSDEEARNAFRRHPVRDLMAKEGPTMVTMLTMMVNSCTISSDEDPLTRTGPPNSDQQNLIREMGFMEKMMEMFHFFSETLRVPMQLFKANFANEWLLCRLGYLLVEKACFENRLCQTRMQKYVPYMRMHIRFEIGSYFTWMAIYAGNRELLMQVKEDDIVNTLEILKSTRSDRVVNYLVEATHFQSNPIQANQEMIARLLFEENTDLLFKVEHTGQDLLLHENSDSGDPELKTVSIRSILADQEENLECVDDLLTMVDLPDSTALRRLRYYLSIVKLLGWVAMGAEIAVKENVIKVMGKIGLSPSQIAAVAALNWIPSTVRSVCLRLWCNAYVVGDPSSRVLMATGTRVWKPTRLLVEKAEQRQAEQTRTFDPTALAREMEETWQCPEEMAHTLRQTLLTIIQAESETDVDLAGKNVFARVLLDCVYELVSFGHFHKPDLEFDDRVPDFDKIREMADAVIPLLDGRDDVCAQFGGWDKDVARFHLNERTKIVMDAKLRVMEIMELFFICAQEQRWSRYINGWTHLIHTHFGITSWEDVVQALYSKANGTASYTPPPVPTTQGHANGGIPALRATFSRATKVCPSASLLDYDSGAKSWTKGAPWTEEEIKELSNHLFGDPPIISEFFSVRNLTLMFQRGNHFFIPEWVALLLDLVQYDSHQLKEKALSFLIATFTSHAGFVSKLQATQVISSPEIAKIFFAVRREMGILRNHIPLISSPDKAQSERGFLVVESIVKHWTTILTWQRPKAMTQGLQKVIADLGADEIAVRILFIPFKRVRPDGPGKLDTVVLLNGDPGARLIQLFTNLYRFLSALCDGNTPIQNKLIKYCEWKSLHLGIEGLDVELLLASSSRDNYEIVKRVGDEWIDVFFGMMKQYKYREAKFLMVLEPMIKCNGTMMKENQSKVSILFRENEDVVGYFMKSNEEWEHRIELMKHEPKEDQRDDLSFHLAVIRLLVATSEGRSPSSEVYAAKYLSFKDACKTFSFLDFNKNGEQVPVLKTQLYRVRSEYLLFLLNVYCDTRVQSLLDELNEVGNGLWVFDDDPSCDCSKHDPLMVVFEKDIRRFLDMASKTEDKDMPCLRGLHSYLFAAVIPFLTLYFSTHYIKVRGRTYGDDELVAHKLFEAVEAIVDTGLPEGFELLYVGRGPIAEEIDCVQSSVELLKAMSQKGRVREDWAQHNQRRPREAKRTETEYDRQVRCWRTLTASYDSLYEALSRHVGISDTRRMISTGVLKLGMLLSRRGEVPIYNNIDYLALGRSTPKNPMYDDFLFAILAISRAGDRIDPKLLTNILRVFRAAIYTYEPGDTGRTLAEVTDQWEAFLHYEPVEKMVGPKEATLAWVQNRYDALGCTTAALRLMGSANKAVQVNAVALLMVLLQGGNPRVQRTVLNQLRIGKDVGLFSMAKNVLEASVVTLEDFRRVLKKHKVAFNNGIDVAHKVRDETMLTAMNIDSFGRGSLVMMTLRMLQLLCKRHFRPLQTLLLTQTPALISHNLITACITLLAAAVPLLEDSLEYNVGDVGILCMEILDTLAEAVQGPNLVVGQTLLDSGMLAVVCNVIQATGYVSLPMDRKRACGHECSVNDIKVWLRRAAARCMLAVLEGVQDEKRCEKVRKYVDMRLLCSHIVQTARLIGKVRPSDMSDDDVASAVVDDNDNDFINNNSTRFGSTRAGSISGGSMRAGSIMGGSMIGLGGETNRRLPPPTEMGFSKGFEKGLENEMFKLYFVLLHLQEFDRSGEASTKITTMLKAHNRLRSFFTDFTCHVELLRRMAPNAAPIVVKVFFRLNKHVKTLTDSKDFRQRTEESLFDVPRNNPQEKAEAFFHKLRYAVNSIQWVLAMSGHPVRRFFIRYRDVFDNIPIIISVTITCLLLFCYGIPKDPHTGRAVGEGRYYTRGDPPVGYEFEAQEYPFAAETSDPTGVGARYGTLLHEVDLSLQHRVKLVNRWESEPEWELFEHGKIVIYILSALHVLMSCCNAVVYLVQDLPLIVWETLDKYQIKMGCHPSQQEGEEEEEEDHVMVGVQRRRKRLTGRAYLRSMPDPPTDLPMKYSMELYSQLFRANNTTFYVGLNLAISILGLVSSPFFFVFQMLDYFRMRDGRLVLRSIIVGGPNLLRSFVLGIIVIVCFGFMSYTYFSPTVNADQEQCHSPWQCVTKHILDSMTGDLTTVLGTDLGVWAFSAVAPWQDLWYTWRTFFVFISLIFWVFLLQGIIQGQIIDAFAEMRSESNQAKEDLEQKCFVSSLERYAFADFPGEWEKRRGGRFAWNYLHFASYLNTMDPDEFDGHELAVHNAYTRLSAEFLPVGEFFAHTREGEHDDMSKDFNTVNDRLCRLEKTVSGFSDMFTKEMKKMRARQTMGSAIDVIGHHMPHIPRPSLVSTHSDVSLDDVGSAGVTRTHSESEGRETPVRTLSHPPESGAAGGAGR